jgi:O-methyltransferase involved in polyketide biosynthesis
VHWFDVDRPEVISLREQLYEPPTGHYRATDPLSSSPRD